MVTVTIGAEDVLEQVRRAIQNRRQRLEIARKYGDAERIATHSDVIDELDGILYVFRSES